MGIQDIEEEIVNLRVQNRYAAVKLQGLYDEVDGFMERYYNEVGELCLKISEIEDKQKQYKRKIKNNSASPLFSEDSKTIIGYNEIRPRKEVAEISMDKEAKSLHRKLIKIIHPDVSEEKLKAAEYTRMVNEAYNQKNFTQLVQLDQIINSGKATERDLVKQRNKLIDATFDLKIQSEQVTETPVFKLMNKFKSQDDQGTKMLAQIRMNLEAKAKIEKSKLLDLKLEYLEKVKEKITA